MISGVKIQNVRNSCQLHLPTTDVNETDASQKACLECRSNLLTGDPLLATPLRLGLDACR